jgi:hypothetical protein
MGSALPNHLAFSEDQGDTWSDPILVAGGGDEIIQFWPTVSIQSRGTVDITYYESEETDLDPEDDEECVVYGAGGIEEPIRISMDKFFGYLNATRNRVTGRISNYCVWALTFNPHVSTPQLNR